MVNLLEYQGKALFNRYGIPIPEGLLLVNKAGIKDEIIHYPAVLKAQVPIGHRGTSGGVQTVKNGAELAEKLNSMQKASFGGFTPKAFLLERLVKHDKELYLSITLDRSKRSPVLIASQSGGVNIEDVPKEEINTFTLNQLEDLPIKIKQQIFALFDIKEVSRFGLYNLLDSMWSLYKGEDAELVEINPLAVSDDILTALDSKIIIDDDALFRHPYIKPDLGTNPLEIKAKKEGISFVKLDGDIGIIANGAGLTMSTIDQIALLGGKPGDFLDLGGTDDPEKVSKAISLVYESKPAVLLINIFGGVTKADTVAEGILLAIKKEKPAFKVVVRLRGFNEEKGRNLLRENGVEAFTDMTEAIHAAVTSVKS